MQLTLAALCAFLCLSASSARADESSGTWTGNVELRGNYYWETSTRVVAPEVSGELRAPNGVRLNARYLIDSITSASVGAGARIDIRFTELRHDATLGAGYEFDLGESQLDVTLSSRYSQEPDYSSLSGTLATALSLEDRATVLRLNVTGLHDEVGQVLRGANRASPDGRDLSDRGKQGDLNGVVLNVGWSQVLTRHLLLDVGYDFGFLSGYIQNPYRLVMAGGLAVPEQHPDERLRHTISARLAYHLAPTGTSFHAIYRAYIDSWDIAALTPEGRIYQEIGDLFLLRLRYRYYTQTQAFFLQPGGYTMDDLFVTADPKMTAFESHMLGAQAVIHLDFLERSALDFAWQAMLEIGVDYVWRTNRFGDGIVAQAALHIPF
jgi:hypothetical protein